MQQYVITLKNEKASLYNRFTINAIVLNGLLLACFCFTSEASKQNITIASIGIAIIIGFFFIYPYLKKIQDRLKIGYAVLFGLLMILWILLGKYPPAIAQVIIAVMSVIAIRKFIVSIYPDKIIYPSFPKRSIQWNELGNVLLKDGLLTIDFKNNKIIQQYINESDPPLNEQEFNEFCSQHLQSASSI